MKTLILIIAQIVALSSFAQIENESALKSDLEFMRFDKLNSQNYEIKKCSFAKSLILDQDIRLSRLNSTSKRSLKKQLKNRLNKVEFKTCWRALKEVRKISFHNKSDITVKNALNNRGCDLESFGLLKSHEACTEFIKNRRTCLKLEKVSKAKRELKNTGDSLRIVAGILFFPAFFFPTSFDNSRNLLKEISTQIHRNTPEIIRVGIYKNDTFNLSVESVSDSDILQSTNGRYYMAPTNHRWGEQKFIKKFRKVFTWDFSTTEGEPSYINSSCEA